MAEDYCELCDLPLSTCVHGRPPPSPPPAPAPRASAVRTTRAPAAGRTPGAGRAASRTPGAPTPARAPSRVVRQESFRPHVLAVLHDAGGELETDAVLEQLADRMADQLQERDRQVAPSGEVRWHTTARKERKAMIDEGLMEGARPGVWALTPRGTSLA